VRGRFSVSPGSLHPFGFRSPSFRDDLILVDGKIQVHSRKCASKIPAKIAASCSLSLSLSRSLATQRGTLIRNVSHENTPRGPRQRWPTSRQLTDDYIFSSIKKMSLPNRANILENCTIIHAHNYKNNRRLKRLSFSISSNCAIIPSKFRRQVQFPRFFFFISSQG